MRTIRPKSLCISLFVVGLCFGGDVVFAEGAVEKSVPEAESGRFESDVEIKSETEKPRRKSVDEKIKAEMEVAKKKGAAEKEVEKRQSEVERMSKMKQREMEKIKREAEREAEKERRKEERNIGRVQKYIVT